MRIALGVGGGIAAYKVVPSSRERCSKAATTYRSMMTRAASEILQPLTLAALTGNKVITGLFSGGNAQETLSSAVEHIAVSKECEVLVVAPATADLLAKFAHGLQTIFFPRYILPLRGRWFWRRR